MAPRALVPVQHIFSVEVPSRRARFSVVVEDVALAFVDVDRVENRGCLRRAVNALAVRVVPGYTHVEFAFTLSVRGGSTGGYGVAPGGRLLMSCAVLMGETLKMEVKRYDLDFYEMHRLELAPEQRDALFAHCRAQVMRTPPVAFNTRGFWLNFVVPEWARTDGRGQRAFCSEYVVRTLHALDLVGGAAAPALAALVPYATTPQQLFDALAAHRRFNVGLVAHVHAGTAPLRL